MYNQTVIINKKDKDKEYKSFNCLIAIQFPYL